MAGALNGIRIIDLSLHISGPFGTSLLADQGADVIKVEQPSDSEAMRYVRPVRDGLSAMYTALNRNKRSIALDLRGAQGKQVLADLLKDADVLVQNFRPGVIERLGFSYDRVREINPRIIFVSINGFGSDGPHANRRAYDQIMQATAGFGAIQADPHTGEPQLLRTAICDKVTALLVAQGITAALLARSRGGEALGQHIEIPMLDAALWFFWPDCMNNQTFVGGDVPRAPLNAEVFRIRKTKNGHLMVVMATQGEFAAACRVLGRPELAEDPRFATAADRYANVGACNEAMAPLFAELDNQDIYERLLAVDVPVALVNDRDTVLEDPQVKARGVVREIRHPGRHPIREAQHPITFKGTGADGARPTPRLGEHTGEILRELGYSQERIAELEASQTVLIRSLSE